MKRKILREIIIGDYPDKVLVSKARRPVYYVSKNAKVNGKTDIPKSYLNNPKFKFDDRGILTVVATGEPKLANPQLAGQPRYWVVNFQQIWNGAITGANRAALVNKLKDILTPFVRGIRPLKTEDLPVKLEFFIYDTTLNADVSNKGVIYVKVIEDLLVSLGKIGNDSREFINDTGRIKFIEVPNESEKKMIVRISKSDNLAV